MTFTPDTILALEAPEDLFGDLPADPETARAEIKALHRRLARDVHPDRGPAEQYDTFADAFQRLTELTAAAERAVSTGMYGERVTPVKPIVIRSRVQTYRVDRLVARGAIANLYGAGRQYLKVGREPADNQLLAREAKLLDELLADPGIGTLAAPYLPAYLETFEYADGAQTRRAIAFDRIDGLYTLSAVRERYPLGVHPKDMAWMFRRLLMALGFAHSRGIVHSAVVGRHVLIHPGQHGLVLVDWTAATRHGRPADDIAMAAQCMTGLLGGDRIIPRPLRAFFAGCTHPQPARRPQDAWALLDEFDELLERMWGRRAFRPFDMN